MLMNCRLPTNYLWVNPYRTLDPVSFVSILSPVTVFALGYITAGTPIAVAACDGRQWYSFQHVRYSALALTISIGLQHH